MAGPRYTQFGPVLRFANGHAVTCEDCGAVVTDEAAHTRFHSILSAHAWALAVLQTAHINAATHAKFDAYQKIKSRTFDNWSAEALAEVVAELDGEPDA